jgi:large subunit ribosomal protein L24e
MSLFLQRKKPAKLVWTTTWRVLHKKGVMEAAADKKKRRKVKIQRAVCGVSSEDIMKKKKEKPEVRAAAREAALREAKARQKKGGKKK